MSGEKSFNDAHTSTVHEDTMCCVMPLRLGIFLIALCTVFFSFFSLVSNSFAEALLYFTGGFCLKSRLALGFIEFTGVIFGICGAIGAWYCRRSYIMTFNLWQVLRIGVFGYIYYVDIPLLQGCELWVNDVDAMIAKYGWNDLMYKVAMAAVCNVERNYFYAGSIFTFLLLLYMTWCTHRYLEEVGRVPRHLLRVPKDPTSGAWYAHSLGEKHHMNGAWGQGHGLAPPAQIFHGAGGQAGQQMQADNSYGAAMPQAPARGSAFAV